MSGRPSAAARMWDVAALALAIGGGAVYLAAHAGMKQVLATQVHVSTIEAPNLQRWVHYRTMSNIGLALVVAGVLVGIAAFVRSRRESADLLTALPDGAPLVPPNAPQP